MGQGAGVNSFSVFLFCFVFINKGLCQQQIVLLAHYLGVLANATVRLNFYKQA